VIVAFGVLVIWTVTGNC